MQNVVVYGLGRHLLNIPIDRRAHDEDCNKGRWKA